MEEAIHRIVGALSRPYESIPVELHLAILEFDALLANTHHTDQTERLGPAFDVDDRIHLMAPSSYLNSLLDGLSRHAEEEKRQSAERTPQKDEEGRVAAIILSPPSS